MATTKVEFIIDPNGQVIRRDTVEYTVKVEEKLLDTICDKTAFKVKAVFNATAENGPVNMTILRDYTLFSVPLPHLKLRAPFKVINSLRQKVLTPNFSSKNDPVLDLNWLPADGMRLRLIVMVQPDGAAFYCGKCWLLAFDARGAAYNLPMANLYDDASICTGEFVSRRNTNHEVILAALDQFNASRWNHDLMNGSKEEKSNKLFQFKPDSFEQLPPPAAWTNFTDKISTPITQQAIP